MGKIILEYFPTLCKLPEINQHKSSGSWQELCKPTTDQFRHSYFVKTIVQWNTFSEPQVLAGTINEFSHLSCGLYSK